MYGNIIHVRNWWHSSSGLRLLRCALYDGLMVPPSGIPAGKSTVIHDELNVDTLPQESFPFPVLAVWRLDHVRFFGDVLLPAPRFG